MPAGHMVIALNDQYCYVGWPSCNPLAVGDLIGFGISHPCTTFDKWRVLFVVDDRFNIIDAVGTLF
jgi:D-serine dehydratase